MPAPLAVATAAGVRPQASPNGGSAVDMSDFSDSADFEWNLADEAEDTEFEIDAAATSFFMPQGNRVTFKAKALNGTPPFTFTWNFGDDSPEGTGEMIKHAFAKLGNIDVVVIGRDASGATSRVTLKILVATREDYATRLNLDLEATPAPAVTP